MSRLDDDLRLMLRTRARDVQDVPPHVVHPHRDDLRPARAARRRWPTVAAVVGSVAATAAAALAVVAVSGSGHHRTPAATGSHTRSAAPITPTVVRECGARLPGSWRRAFSVAEVPTGPGRPELLAVGADGGLLVARQHGADSSDVVMTSAARGPRVVFSLGTGEEILSGGIYRNQAVLGLYRIDPARLLEVTRIVRVDLGTGHVTPLETTSGTQRVDAMGLAGRLVLWTSRPDRTSRSTTLHSYDLATEQESTAPAPGAGPDARERVGDAGIAWVGRTGLAVHAGPPLPPVVRRATTPQQRATLSTDGNNYAWWDERTNRVGWWQAGMAAPRYVRLAQPGEVDAEDYHGHVGVSGPYVTGFSGGTSWAVDVRTGARVRLPVLAAAFVSRGGVAAATIHKGDRNAVIALPLATMPELQCS